MIIRLGDRLVDERNMRGLQLFVWALLFMSCGAPSTPELQLVHDAAATLGGAGEIEDVYMLRLTGNGESYWTGENPSPDANPPNFFSTFTRIYDWRDQRFRFEELQTPRFVTPNYDTKRFVMALDGNVAFDIDQYDKSSRQRDHLVRIRKGELLHHPVGVLQIALDPSTTLSGLRQRENYQVIDIETEEGINVTLFVDRQSKRPVRVKSAGANSMLGDVEFETEFSSYRDVDGLMLPTRIIWWMEGEMVAEVRDAINTVWRIDGEVVGEIRDGLNLARGAGRRRLALESEIDAEVGRLEVPRLVAMMSPEPVPPLIESELLSEGVWRLGSVGYFSLLVEFSDHLRLIDIPLSGNHTRGLFAKVRELVPHKPLTHVVVTHHHFDHSAGLRVAVSEGLTLLLHEPIRDTTRSSPGGGARSRFLRGTKDFFEELIEREHTYAPDALARNPQKLKAELVAGKYIIDDELRTLELYHVTGSRYADTLLMAYLPAERLLYEADVYSPPQDPLSPMSRREPYFPFAPNLLENVENLELDVERVVPAHGPIVPLEDLIKAAESPFERPE